jgi:hypothetical protein
VWCNEFKDGRKGLNDDPEKQRGRTRVWHTDEDSRRLYEGRSKSQVFETVEGTGIAVFLVFFMIEHDLTLQNR